MPETLVDQYIDKVVKVRGYEGVAFYVDDYDQKAVPSIAYMWDDENDCEIEVEDWDEYETIPVLGSYRCHMIGDDQMFVFDVADLTVLHDDDYCSGCGQIGCGW